MKSSVCAGTETALLPTSSVSLYILLTDSLERNVSVIGHTKNCSKLRDYEDNMECKRDKDPNVELLRLHCPKEFSIQLNSCTSVTMVLRFVVTIGSMCLREASISSGLLNEAGGTVVEPCCGPSSPRYLSCCELG